MLSMVLFSVDLFMLLEVLGTLERLVADFADVWLERGVHYRKRQEREQRDTCFLHTP